MTGFGRMRGSSRERPRCTVPSWNYLLIYFREKKNQIKVLPLVHFHQPTDLTLRRYRRYSPISHGSRCSCPLLPSSMRLRVQLVWLKRFRSKLSYALRPISVVVPSRRSVRVGTGMVLDKLRSGIQCRQRYWIWDFILRWWIVVYEMSFSRNYFLSIPVFPQIVIFSNLSEYRFLITL